MHAAHLAGLRRDLEAPGGADERHRGLVAGAGDLEGGGAARVGERAVGEERAAPDGGELFARSGGEAVRQAADRAAAGVEQSGLAGEGLAAVDARARGSVLVRRRLLPEMTETSLRTP